MKIKIIFSLYLTLLILLVSSEFLNAMFNTRFDLENASLAIRIAAAFKPSVLALYFIFTTLLTLLVFKHMTPLFQFFKKKNNQEQMSRDEIKMARKAAVKMPRTILIFEMLVWFIGTTAYYALKHWNADSGIPYPIGLLLKVSSGFVGGLYSIFIINLIVLPLKRGLEIDQIDSDETDFFARNKDTFAIIGVSFYLLINMIYLAFYFSERNLPITGRDFSISIIPAVLFLFIISLGPHLLSRREYKLQVNSLLHQLTSLAGRESSDLESVFLTNFDELGDLTLSTNSVVGRFRNILEKIERTIDDLSSSSRMLSQNSHENALSSNEQAAAAAEIVATMEDSDKLSKGIEDLAVDVENKSKENSEMVDVGVGTLKKYMTIMDSLKESNLKSQDFIQSLDENIKTIMDVSNIIKAIADQVKIIAFNAELEAAAAGEAGKNFEIVASEVRRLADNTLNAATEIRQKIASIEKESSGLFNASEETTHLVDKGWDMSRETEDIFKVILDSSSNTSRSAQSIVSNIQLQISGFEQILDAMKHISGAASKFSESTQSSADTATDLERYINALKDALK